MDAVVPGSLLAHLAAIPDPRDPKGQRHPLPALLAVSAAAILCGARSFAAIAHWARCQDLPLLHRLGFKRRPPTKGTYQYLFRLLDLTAFETALRAWIDPLLPPPQDGTLQPVALDGKTLRGSFSALRPAVHLLAVLDQRTGCVLSQLAVGQKTNEPKAALELLGGLVLRGRVVTGDAIFCQRDLAKQIRDQGGHYFFWVKDNQPTLLSDIDAAFEGAFSPLRSQEEAVRGRLGQECLAPRRTHRGADAPNDPTAERLPGLAGRRAGLPAGA